MGLFEQLQYMLRLFCQHIESHQPQVLVTLMVDRVSVTVNVLKGKIMFSLPDDKTANATVSYVDAKGNPAMVDGAPVWSSSDDTVLTVVASSDGMSAVVTPVGPLGTVQLKVEADADLGAGVVSVVSLVDVEIIAGQAVAGNVNLSIA